MFVGRCVRLVPKPKYATLVLNRRITQKIHGDLTTRLSPAISTMYPSESRNIHTISEHRTSASTSTMESIRPKTGFIERTLRKAGILDIQKYRYMLLGYLVYEHVMKQVDYPFFFKHFNMPDTFVSWFLVTELHVWMIMVRYMADEKDGKIIRKHAVSAMWDDTKARIEKLGPIKSKLKNEQIREIWYQFNAAIIGYDEGIQSDDKTLAAALWRRFFKLECNNPEHVETLVIYVRKQICLFDSIPNHKILRRPIFKLIDIKTLCKHQ